MGLYFGASSGWRSSEVVVNFNPINPVSAETEGAACYLKSLRGGMQSREMVNLLSENEG